MILNAALPGLLREQHHMVWCHVIYCKSHGAAGILLQLFGLFVFWTFWGFAPGTQVIFVQNEKISEQTFCSVVFYFE